MKKRIFALTSVSVALTLLLAGCGGIEGTVIGNGSTAARTSDTGAPVATTAPFAPIDPSAIPNTEPQPAPWHPEALWTPESVGATADAAKHFAKNNVYIGKYGVYEKGKRLPIEADQPIAFVLDIKHFPAVELMMEGGSEYEAVVSDELKPYLSKEEYDRYYAQMAGGFYLPFMEDYMEKAGYTVIRDHAQNWERISGDGLILFLATEEQMQAFQPPVNYLYYNIYGASVEDFAPTEG